MPAARHRHRHLKTVCSLVSIECFANIEKRKGKTKMDLEKEEEKEEEEEGEEESSLLHLY